MKEVLFSWNMSAMCLYAMSNLAYNVDEQFDHALDLVLHTFSYTRGLRIGAFPVHPLSYSCLEPILDLC